MKKGDKQAKGKRFGKNNQMENGPTGGKLNNRGPKQDKRKPEAMDVS